MNKLIKLDFKIKTIGSPNKAIIALHGWGGNSSSMKALVNLMKIGDCKWFFPEGPYPCDQKLGKSWTYKKDDGTFERNKPIELLHKFIQDNVLSLFDPCDIYIIGFSQGALMCYEGILTMDISFGGVFPICGFMALNNKQYNYPHPALKNTPIYIGHGKNDNVVSVESSKEAYDIIKNANFNVELCIYSGGHKIGIDYLRKMKSVIKQKK